MTAKISRLFVGLAALSALAGPALAGGDEMYGYGSTKDMAGVPVPAPIPVPIYDPVWYFRFDSALGLADAPSVSEAGMIFGEMRRGYGADHRYRTSSDWIENDFEQVFAWGIGVGFRWSERFRTDVTAETLREQKVRLDGYARAPLVDLTGTIPGYASTTLTDSTTIRGGAVLFNAYWDFAQWGAFKPYIGGGLGFGVTELYRKNDTMERAVDRSSGTAQTTQLYHERSDDREHDVSLAATATVGTTYQLSDVTELDFNYRYLYVGGAQVGTSVHGHNSDITIDDLHEHQLRAGLRFNVN